MVPIRVARTPIRWIRRVALGDRPSVVRARDGFVHFLPRLLPHVVDEHPWRRPGGVAGKRERVAKAQCPDRAIRADRREIERVVFGDRAVGVDPQHLAETGRHGLGVAADAVVADGYVELAIGSEIDGAADVCRVGQVVEVHDHELAAGHSNVAVGREAAHTTVRDRATTGRYRVVDVDILVARKIRVEGHTKQAALASGVYGETHERRGLQHAGLDYPEPPSLFTHEQSPVRGKLHRRRTRKAGGGDERSRGKTWRHARGRGRHRHSLAGRVPGGVGGPHHQLIRRTGSEPAQDYAVPRG